MDAVLEAVTLTVARTFPTAPNRGDLTVREVIDAYVATYSSLDGARASAQRQHRDALSHHLVGGAHMRQGQAAGSEGPAQSMPCDQGCGERPRPCA